LTSNHIGSNHARSADPARPEDLPDVLQFMQLLWAVAHGLETTSRRMTQAIGVTGTQRLVLRVVGLFPGISAGTLATVLHVHPSTLTGVLQRLARQQMVLRVDHPFDRRRAVLRLTVRGKRVNKVKLGTVESAIAEALDGVSDRDRTAAMRVLGRLADHLEASPSPKRSGRLVGYRPPFGRGPGGRLHA
jgi:DNA-binding MarR family transcriptional regulator